MMGAGRLLTLAGVGAVGELKKGKALRSMNKCHILGVLYIEISIQAVIGNPESRGCDV